MTSKVWRSYVLMMAGVAGGALLAQPVAAQVVLPSRQEVTPPAPDTRQESGVSVDSSRALEQPACPFETSSLKVTLTTLSFVRPDGGALQPEIAEAVAGIDVPQGEQPISVVCALRDRANAALRHAGWVASVQIPAQEITGGTLQLQVVTARIVEVRVRGSAGPYDSILRERIAQIQALDPLNEKKAERLLLLAGDIPGLEVQLSLRPAGTRQGEVIGELSLAFRRFAVIANVQNQNSRLTGRETGYARAEIYGLTGLSDVTYVGVSSTADFKEQRVVQAGHIMGLDRNGTTLGARFTYAWSRPDLGALDLRTNTLITGFDLARPLIRSLRTNLRATGGFDYVDQRSVVRTEGGSVPLTLDKLRIGFIGIDGDYRTVRYDGATAFSIASSLQVRKGVDVFGSSDIGFANGRLTSRIDGNSRALVVRGTVDTVIGVGPIFSLAGQGQAQWTNDPLLNYEEFSVGNLTIGRGYDPGVSTGDRAVGGRGEVRAELPLITGLGTQLFGFYDHVYLRNLDRNAIEPRRTYRSYGGGARFSLPGLLVLEVMYAHPLDRVLKLDEKRPPNRVLVSLTAQFRDKTR